MKLNDKLIAIGVCVIVLAIGGVYISKLDKTKEEVNSGINGEYTNINNSDEEEGVLETLEETEYEPQVIKDTLEISLKDYKESLDELYNSKEVYTDSLSMASDSVFKGYTFGEIYTLNYLAYQDYLKNENDADEIHLMVETFELMSKYTELLKDSDRDKDTIKEVKEALDARIANVDKLELDVPDSKEVLNYSKDKLSKLGIKK